MRHKFLFGFIVVFVLIAVFLYRNRWEYSYERIGFNNEITIIFRENIYTGTIYPYRTSVSYGNEDIEYIKLYVPSDCIDTRQYKFYLRDILARELRFRGYKVKLAIEILYDNDYSCDLIANKSFIAIEQASNWPYAHARSAMGSSIYDGYKQCIALFDFHKLSSLEKDALRKICSGFGTKIIIIHTVPVWDYTFPVSPV